MLSRVVDDWLPISFYTMLSIFLCIIPLQIGICVIHTISGVFYFILKTNSLSSLSIIYLVKHSSVNILIVLNIYIRKPHKMLSGMYVLCTLFFLCCLPRSKKYRYYVFILNFGYKKLRCFILAS